MRKKCCIPEEPGHPNYIKTISREEMQKINESIQIMIMDADGGGQQKITESNSNFDNPVWAPGGKDI